MITEEHIKEKLSMAYAQAIAANAGVKCDKYDLDYGMDGRFSSVTYDEVYKRYCDDGFGIDFQLKATTNAKMKDGKVKYSLEVKNYRDLISTKAGSPRILVLYAMPKNREEWLNSCNENVILKKCGWWCSLKGNNETSNKERITIEIPEENLLTSEELNRLIECVKMGEEL
jgi:hypothetical protein